MKLVNIVEKIKTNKEKEEIFISKPERIWVRSSRFWYFFHDLHYWMDINFLSKFLSETEVADCLEKAIMDFNWIVVKNSKRNFHLPFNLDELNRLKSSDWSQINKLAESRCRLASALKQDDKELIEKAKIELKKRKEDISMSCKSSYY